MKIPGPILTLAAFIILQIALSTGLLDKAKHLKLIDITIIIQNDDISEKLYTTKKDLQELPNAKLFKSKGKEFVRLNNNGSLKIYNILEYKPSFFELLNKSLKIKWLYWCTIVGISIGGFFITERFGTKGAILVTLLTLFFHTLLTWTVVTQLNWIGWGGFLFLCGINYGIKFFHFLLRSA